MSLCLTGWFCALGWNFHIAWCPLEVRRSRMDRDKWGTLALLHMLLILQHPLGMVSRGSQRNRSESQLQCTSVFQRSACVTFTDVSWPSEVTCQDQCQGEDPAKLQCTGKGEE